MDIKKDLKNIINESLSKMNIDGVSFIVEVPKNKENGDYSTNVAMELTKVLRKNPREIQ